MKVVRPIELEKCTLCGREFDKLTMTEVFTGRVKYICRECAVRGRRQVDAMQQEWRRSSRGKAVIEQCEKHSK